MATEETNQNEQHQQGEEQRKKGGIHNNALYAAGMGRAATAQVDPHSNSGLAQTGTNVSYEGPTAPGSGGAAGTGYTSGQAGTGASIATDSDYDQARVGNPNSGQQDDADSRSAENEIDEQR